MSRGHPIYCGNASLNPHVYLNSRRVDVLLGVDHSEKHLHKALSLILEKHIHLADHGLLELIFGLLLLDEGEDVLGQRSWIRVTAGQKMFKFQVVLFRRQILTEALDVLSAIV